jgi:hypothetical protein
MSVQEDGAVEHLEDDVEYEEGLMDPENDDNDNDEEGDFDDDDDEQVEEDDGEVILQDENDDDDDDDDHFDFNPSSPAIIRASIAGALSSYAGDDIRLDLEQVLRQLDFFEHRLATDITIRSNWRTDSDQVMEEEDGGNHHGHITGVTLLESAPLRISDDDDELDEDDPTSVAAVLATRLGEILSRLPKLNSLQIRTVSPVGNAMVAPILWGFGKTLASTRTTATTSTTTTATTTTTTTAKSPLLHLELLALSNNLVTDGQAQDIANALLEVPALQQLQNVNLTGFHADSIQHALTKLPCLKKLMFLHHNTTVDPNHPPPTFQPILTAMVHYNWMLPMILLYNFDWDERFSPTMASGSFSSGAGAGGAGSAARGWDHPPSASTSTLGILDLRPCNLTGEKWQQAMSFLGTNKALVAFSITCLGHGVGANSGALLAETMQHVASNRNSPLQHLELSIFSAGVTTANHYIHAVQQLSHHQSTLRVLNISTCDRGVKRPIDFNEEEYHRLVDALRQNYYLLKCHGVHRILLVGGGDGGCNENNNMKDLESIGNLNRAGRRYLKEDATSKDRAITVFSHDIIRNDLDAIFFHLRENPQLCHRYK